MMADWLGKTVGKVRIDKYLARGGWGEVYLGTHLTLDRPVAIKVLHSFIEQDPDLLKRFQREAKVVAGLRHPNIVQVFDFDTIDGHPYIVMEYFKGPPLADYLHSLHERNERIPLYQVGRLFGALSSALEYAHEQGVIHRDIKPENIMLHGKAGEIPVDRPLGDDVEPILMDFGLVRIANTASQTTPNMISGTPAYMSPEQARGDQADRRTDIYSLGIVLYEMLAGRVPFDADNTWMLIHQQINDPPPLIPGISPALQKVVDRALAKNPEDRYPTSREMAADFSVATGLAAGPGTLPHALPAEPSNTLVNIPQGSARVQVNLPGASTKQTSPLVKPAPAGQKPARVSIAMLSVIGLLALAVISLAIGAVFIYPRLSAPSKATASATSAPAASPSISSTAAVVQNTENAAPTAGPVSTAVSGPPDASGMVEILPGTYKVGSASADEYHSASLDVLLKGYWIDKYQVTAAQYQNFLAATGAESPDVLGKGDQPVRGVTWDQAVAYCSWANKRLPTEAEWEAAGRGPGRNPQLYPWGNDPIAGGNAGKLPDQDTYNVGAFPFNVSPSGVYDLVGNIWEWVGEPYAAVPAGSKILRGGRFGLPVLDLAYRLSVGSSDTRYLKFAGFRCAADQVK
jgi:serine/threonine protein kinase